LILPAVKVELAHANTPAIVRAWISQPPLWMEEVNLKQPVDLALAPLDEGEREAISLASELQAPFYCERYVKRILRGMVSA
jgi:hypothetical protein